MTIAEKYNLNNCPECIYFSGPICGEISWELDERGCKIRKEKTPYKCLLSGKIIKSWLDKCPKKIEKKH